MTRCWSNVCTAWLAEHTNPERRSGTLREALVGADVFIGVSAPRILTGDDVATMAERAIVFALALWEPALTGDLRAVGQVVQIVVARSRLLGLVPLAKKARVKCRQPQTVVLMKDDCRQRGCPDHT